MTETPTIQINNPSTHTNDHDLLIGIGIKLDRAISDIKELKDNTTDRVTALEEEKLGKDEFGIYKRQAETDRNEFKSSADTIHEDHEERIRSNTQLVQWGIGALAGIQALLAIYEIYKSTHP